MYPIFKSVLFLSSLLLLTLIGISPVLAVAVDAPDPLGGRVEAQIDGESIYFPVLKTAINADIQGDLATVEVIQTFANPANTPLNAVYLFPLTKDAAVHAMLMEVGDERVRAQIQRSEEARATFQQAKQEGRGASLLTQHRPNMFTQDIANLMPGLPIKVTLRYTQSVPKVDGDYQLVVPLVVGPRFQPTHAGQPPAAKARIQALNADEARQGGVPRWNDREKTNTGIADSQTPFGQWELEALPAYPPVQGLDIPAQVDAERVALTIRLNGGMPIHRTESRTHAIDVHRISHQQQEITLSQGHTIDNRDFVLRYGLSGETSQAGVLAYYGAQGGFFSLLLEPPASPASAAITPREMVFVLDCSGSMSGLPMQASKAFMYQALRNLRPSDTFRIIRFSDVATEFSTAPLPATANNIRRGMRYTDGLQGSGGTLMTSGIRQALQAPGPEGSVRLVTFLTDGYIGNEAEVLTLIQDQIGSARLFAFGVGTGVNRFLLSEMGRVGRGFARYMDSTENVQGVAVELSNRLQSPVLTDIEIDWGEFKPAEISPQRIPDLFAGQSVRIQGRYAVPGTYTIQVRGLVNGRRAMLPLEVQLPDNSDHGQAVALLWARATIADKMRLLTAPLALREGGVADNQLKQEVTQLGLDFSLMTRWTSFVAVTDKVYNQNPQSTPTRPVPLPQVKGVSELAYGNAATPQFSGHATPEPATMVGLALMALLMAWFLLQHSRQGGMTTVVPTRGCS